MLCLHSLIQLSLVCLVLFLIPMSLCAGELTSANVLCIEKERQALMEFKHALVDHYGRLSSWKSQDCCLWNGVQCNNQTGHVEMLDLHGDDQFQQPLRGQISTSLMDLPYLNFLNLSANDFNYTQIPWLLGFLSKLRYLDLSSASFGGKIPHELGRLSGLLHLDLSCNNLVGVIPNQLGNLSNLQTLRLDWNKYLRFGDENYGDAQWISNLSSLTELGLRTINLHNSNNWLETIGRLPFLTKLWLSDCNLSDVDFRLSSSQPNSSTSLAYLDLGSNNLTSLRFLWCFNISSNLIGLGLENNLLVGPIPYDFGDRLSHIEFLSIPSNQLNGTIPESIRLLSELRHFAIGENSLGGVITDIHFTNLTKLKYLGLTKNPLTWKFNNNWIPPFQLEVLAARHCKVGPAFPKWLQTQNQLSMLDVSHAGISDTTPKLLFLLCGHSLSVLRMSNNQISGKIPNCLSNLKSLVVLDLSSNNLSGNIPITMGSLVEIKQLILRNNMLSGELPSLKSCTKLVLLDVGENNFEGPIPSWLGDNLQNLEMLVLRKNHFNGCLPLHLCHLTSIQILDLSLNNLSGQIPKCLNNFSALSGKHEFIDGTIIWVTYFSYLPWIYSWYSPTSLMWKGKQQEFESERFLKLIDLSSNQLSGEIPVKIGDLVELISLNLSRNNLGGQIPPELGKLHLLDSLDLSRNHLSGEIPSSFSQIDMLGVLDFSNNNLSGKIPTGTQLQSFNASVYSGNPKLCGSPLVTPCSQEISKGRHEDAPNDQGEEYSLFNGEVYVSAGLGFFTGFWGIFGSLLLIRSWRHAYFKFLNNLSDLIYVMATVYAVRLSKWLGN